jgi:hypothetical protein
MTKIRPEETSIVGNWVSDEKGGVVGDDNCRRISDLVQSHLTKLGVDPSGWDVLYQDPMDRRFWELLFPQSHLHGGGPPLLRHLEAGAAREKYGAIAA